MSGVPLTAAEAGLGLDDVERLAGLDIALLDAPGLR